MDILYNAGSRPTDDPAPLPDVVFVWLPGYKSPRYIDEDPRLVPIVPASQCTDCPCWCKPLQVPLRLAWETTIHKCPGMTVRTVEAFRYVIYPGKDAFEAKNPGVLFVALSRA